MLLAGSAKGFSQLRNIGIGDISVIELAGGGNAWLGTTAQGVQVYNPAIHTTDTFNMANTPQLKSDSVTALLHGQLGANEYIFVGTKSGLASYSNGVWDTVSHVSGQNITGLLLTAGDTLWVLTASNGIFIFDSTGQTYLGSMNTGNSAIPGNIISTVQKGNNDCGTYCIATPQSGCFYTSDGSTYSILDTSAAGKYLVDNRVTSVLIKNDCSARLIGTQGGFSSCPPGLPCTNFTTGNGLPENQITAIGEDCHAKVWLGTRDSGVIIYTPRLDSTSKFIDLPSLEEHTYYLSKGAQGFMYGNNEYDGSYNQGLFFWVYPDINNLQLGGIYFDSLTNNFWFPVGNPACVDTTVWGVTQGGGAQGLGTLYRYNVPSTGPSLNSPLILYGAFDTVTGGPPVGIIAGADGFLYGATASCRTRPYGTIFKYTPPPMPSQIHFAAAFDSVSTGAFPDGNLMQASNNMIYGVCPAGGANNKGTIFQFNPNGEVLSKLYDFKGTPDGELPSGPVIRGSNGLLYGTTQKGGAFNQGMLYAFDTATNTVTSLHDFDSAHARPAFLYLAQNGIFYGLTTSGNGSMFQFNRYDGIFTDLYDFNTTDGRGIGTNPYPNMSETPQGNVFGRTTVGGSAGYGTIYMLNPQYAQFGVYTTSNGLASNQVTAIALDPNNCNNTGYIGTADGNITSVDSSGNVAVVTAVDTPLAVRGIGAQQVGVYLYPQPATEQLQFVFSRPVAGAALSLSDISGQQVKDYVVGEESLFSVDVSALSSGIYFYKLSKGNEKLASGKVSIMK